MIGTKTEAYQDIEAATRELTQGLVVSLDPSIGSSSSMPGWAVYRKGELVRSGTFLIPHRGSSIPERLRALASSVRKLYAEYPPDILVYEQIPAQRHGGNAGAHASLLKAVGAILSVPGPDKYVGIVPVSWKAMARDTYVKGDEQDAIEIGYVAITVAHAILEGSTSKKKPRRKNGETE